MSIFIFALTQNLGKITIFRQKKSSELLKPRGLHPVLHPQSFRRYFLQTTFLSARRPFMTPGRSSGSRIGLLSNLPGVIPQWLRWFSSPVTAAGPLPIPCFCRPRDSLLSPDGDTWRLWRNFIVLGAASQGIIKSRLARVANMNPQEALIKIPSYALPGFFSAWGF